MSELRFEINEVLRARVCHACGARKDAAVEVVNERQQLSDANPTLYPSGEACGFRVLVDGEQVWPDSPGVFLDEDGKVECGVLATGPDCGFPAWLDRSTEQRLVDELAGLHRNLFELTDKQTARLAEIGSWLDERHGLHADPEIVFAPEYRRGRGHDVTVYWADGETMARASIDVYGNGDTAVWTLDLVHGGEECECIDCTDDNDEDNNNA